MQFLSHIRTQMLAIIGVGAAFLVFAIFAQASPVQETLTPETEIKTIYWSDGDSGRLNKSKFRLANVDAPETGSLKQRGGAKCELEREKGYEAKAYIVALTKNGTVKVERDYGYDRYQRLVVDLSVDGVDVGERAIADGILKPWPHRNNRALFAKPDWCQK